MKTLECHQCRENVTENLAILVSRKEVILPMHNYKYCIVAIIAFVSKKFLQAYKSNLILEGKDGSQLDETIQRLEHTASSVEIFTSKESMSSPKDQRLEKLITLILDSASGTVVQAVPNLYLLICALTSSQ